MDTLTPHTDAAHGVGPRRRTVPVWVVVTLAVALLVAPTAAVAATLTSSYLIGAGGVRALVTRAGQTETAPLNADSNRAFTYSALTGSDCTAVYTAPPGFAFVLEDLTVDVYVPQTPGPGINVRVATNAACTAEVGDVNPVAVGTTTFPFDPGIVIPAGHSLYAVADNGVAAELYGYGYLEPVADAPNPTPGQPGIVHLSHPDLNSK